MLPEDKQLWKTAKSWKPKSTDREVKEFLESALWEDMQDILTMQENGIGKEILNSATTMEEIWNLRGRNGAMQFLKTLPAYISSMLEIDKKNKQIKEKLKEREKKNE